jgi:hypothetical protein
MVKLSKKRSNDLGSAASQKTVTCVSCGVLLHSNTDADAGQLCLLCQARVLNDKFHNLKKRGDEDRERLVASE